MKPARVRIQITGSGDMRGFIRPKLLKLLALQKITDTQTNSVAITKLRRS